MPGTHELPQRTLGAPGPPPLHTVQKCHAWLQDVAKQSEIQPPSPPPGPWYTVCLTEEAVGTRYQLHLPSADFLPPSFTVESVEPTAKLVEFFGCSPSVTGHLLVSVVTAY
jgi:hypothetical protein